MDIGMLAIFQNYLGRSTDDDLVAGELELALLADESGFDTYWAVEHHFTDYAACPDNLLYLANVAARTEQIRLATGAVIVPWNDPLRVAEKVAFLDHLSGGRAVLGLGRGLARREYDHFGIDMGESRDRFDEGAAMIIDALDDGFIEGDGPYYPQVRTEIGPRPKRGYRDRFYSVGMSPESMEAVARLGARLMVFSTQRWDAFAEGSWPRYCKVYEDTHDAEPPPVVAADLLFCHPDADLGSTYATNYFLAVVDHYELMSEHFSEVGGYDNYATASELFREIGLDAAVEAYLSAQLYGSPDEILERLEWRRGLLGGFDLAMIPFYGGMSADEAKASLQLFAAEVMPELRSW